MKICLHYLVDQGYQKDVSEELEVEIVYSVKDCESCY